eukprot:2224330-Prymnesium_polylepis.3
MREGVVGGGRGLVWCKGTGCARLLRGARLRAEEDEHAVGGQRATFSIRRLVHVETHRSVETCFFSLSKSWQNEIVAATLNN